VTHVWPNKTVFLDFFGDNAAQIWEEGLTDLYQKVPYDGLWLDMNEATAFCNGECPSYGEPSAKTVVNKTEEFVSTMRFLAVDDDSNSSAFTNHSWYLSADNQTDESTYFLPFVPYAKWMLDNMTMSLNATHPTNGFREFDVHSLFGLIESKTTRAYLTSNGSSPLNRTFVLSRSTAPGSGQYAAHWLGDNHRTWDDMKWSISGVMNFNMFGIPMVGPDTCGFFSESRADEEELCARWIQIATFYPFARQHKDKYGGGENTEPWHFTGDNKNWAVDAIFDRYQWIRHMYTCLFEASKSGTTCFDPLMFHYPDDDNVFENYEHTFLVGDALKISPKLEAGNDAYMSYFPVGRWVSMQDFSDVVEVKDTDGQKG